MKVTADKSEVLVAVDDVVARDVLAVDHSVLSTLSNGLGVASDDVTEIDGVVEVCDENVSSKEERGIHDIPGKMTMAPVSEVPQVKTKVSVIGRESCFRCWKRKWNSK